MRKNSISRIIIRAFRTAALLSCMACGKVGTDEHTEWISLSGVPLQLTQSQETKGTGMTLVKTEGQLQASGFGIYGSYTSDGNTTLNVFSGTDAVRVYYDGSASAWKYDDRQPWLRTMHYRFRAYWPYYKADGSTRVDVSHNSNASQFVVTYRLSDNFDLLVATATRYPITEGTGTVIMPFRHALSALRFKIRFKADDAAAEKSDVLTSFHLKGLNVVGSLSYGDATGAEPERMHWITSVFDSESELFRWDGSKTFTDSETATVYDEDGVVFVIPQSIGKDSCFAHFKTRNGNGADNTVSLPADTFEPGHIYTYTFVVGTSSVDVKVDIQDWDEVQSNIDINL